jgi:formate dehydrogenase beta subunit
MASTSKDSLATSDNAATMIVQELHKIQHVFGYLPAEELQLLAERIRTPLYRLQEVASFFPHFRREPPPEVDLQICHDMACHLRGASQIKADLERALVTPAANAASPAPGAGQVDVRYVSCLGRCDRAPACSIGEHLYVGRSAKELVALAKRYLGGEHPAADADAAFAPHSERPWRIDIYEGVPRYDAVRQFVGQNDPQRVIEALKTADLRGMGGAGVPAHQKWTDVANAKGDAKYIICNGDESEPGTFKDRELLLRTPYLVLEGVILAGLLTGATRGYIYIRHEYHEEIAAMQAAIGAAERAGACGHGIFGSSRDFPVEVFTSPGGYICGEQSALVEAMEDHRAQPRNKPPQLETNGLHDKPTLVSNVETFAWAPAIAVRGGEWYRDQGVAGCKGLRFFSISGDVNRPGAYEVPCGITLRQFLKEHALGVSGELKAFAPSGPSGGFLPARLPVKALGRGWETRAPAQLVEKVQKSGGTHLDILDLELDLQRFRDVGLMLGAGVVVYNEQADMIQEALNCVEFYRNESCGKCVPCRIGSQKIVEIAQQLCAGGFGQADFAETQKLVDELARAMEMTSICGLGVVAPKPLTSAVQFFPDDLAPYLSGQLGPRKRNR